MFMSILIEKVKSLPEEPGVYFFKRGSENLYIGKATSLRDRVRSYFSKDLPFTRSPLIVEMLSLADDIAFQQTDSVLEALILEANLIKQFQPAYNTKEKDDKSWNYVVITKEKFPCVLTIRGKDLLSMITKGKAEIGEVKVADSFGPFPHGLQLREAIKIVRRIFPFRDAKCTPKENQKNQAGKPCFNRQIGLCPGVCTGELSALEYKKQIRHIKLFFEGKKRALLKLLAREMKAYAKKHEFEKAEDIKRKTYALKHIHDVALLKRDEENGKNGDVFRIEAYDIAHLSGTSTVGVMTVVENGEAKKAEYRMFKIRGNFGVNDIASLQEVLRRRFKHAEWQMPDLVVMDGGVAQKNAGEAVLAELTEEIRSKISLVSVVKNEKHKAEGILGDKKLAQEYKNSIILANSEAHRFAIGYHRKLRRLK